METIEWKVSNTPVPYPESVEFMTKTVQSIISGTGRELVWLLEHPDIYTRGSSARANELKYQPVAPIYSTGRGGRYTYHGPGQRVVYLMMDLRTRGRDIRKYVYNLESLLINTIGEFGIKGERRHGRIGVWVSQGNNMDVKLGAIGVRVRKWVTSHGISLNISPNLAMYDAIVPCGINGHGISSLQELGVPALMRNVDEILCQNFQKIFGDIEFTT
ncbi:MAG: lipoate-protein ligase B [Rhodospirillaceae bacterium]|nr:lipoate-protein ligase B [Rhodospirillaceae bacterium]